MGGTLDGRTAGGDVRQDVDFLQTYPDIIRLGATWRLPGDRVEIRTDGEFVRWSVFERQCVVLAGKDCNVESDGSPTNGNKDIVINVPRNWKNTLGYRVGIGYLVRKELELFGSAAFTTSAVRSLEPSLTTMTSAL